MLQELTFSQSTAAPGHPLQLLEQISKTQESGCVLLSDGEVDWRFYFNDRKLIYASHSLEPSERLERHLLRLSNEYDTLTPDVRQQIRQSLDNFWLNDFCQFPDYQAIIWLVDQYYLPPEAAPILVQRLTQEVLEIYLLLPSVFSKKSFAFTNELPIFWQSDLNFFLRQCRQRLRLWLDLKSHLYSPYQRPYFFLNAYALENLSPDQQRKFGQLFKGASLYELSAILNKDVLSLARRIDLFIVNQAIVLREPLPSFEKLPRLTEFEATVSGKKAFESKKSSSYYPSCPLPIRDTTKYKIACVNVHLILLKEIQNFLVDSPTEIFLINDAAKALLEINSLQPDIILIDHGLTNLDSYQFCSNLRKASSALRTIPIIMLTNKKGIVNRAKARLSGVTDYVTKPLTQVELLKTVFQYLG
jgi:twitching motility two-component system response regulator PilG